VQVSLITPPCRAFDILFASPHDSVILFSGNLENEWKGEHVEPRVESGDWDTPDGDAIPTGSLAPTGVG
jgi:hypothetical protein